MRIESYKEKNHAKNIYKFNYPQALPGNGEWPYNCQIRETVWNQ